jgi:hypothetical protein
MSNESSTQVFEERRAPVQCSGPYRLIAGYPARDDRTRPPGTIAWSEHVEAWEAYASRFGRNQSAERIEERGGFGHAELVYLLGREPTTWLPQTGHGIDSPEVKHGT